MIALTVHAEQTVVLDRDSGGSAYAAGRELSLDKSPQNSW